MRGVFAVIIGLAVVAGWAVADTEPKDAPKPDPKLVGRWLMVRSFYGAKETTDDEVRVDTEFTADGKWIIRRDGKEQPGSPWQFTTDTSASPARIDLIHRPDHPTDRLVDQGIYKVEGDTLTLRTPERGEGRPESFEAPGKGFRSIYKRVTKKDAAVAPKDPPKPDPKLVGRWKVERAFAGETETTEKDPVEYEFTADGKWVFRRGGKDSVSGPGKFTTDPKAAPAQIDLVYELADFKERLELKGIYKLDGDTLTVRTAERGGDRPAAFDGPGKGYRVVLKRIKKE